jgi:hypothetical protein
MITRRSRLRPATFVLALLVLAPIVTGVAASATKTAIPRHMIGSWWRPNWGGDLLFVRPRGKVLIRDSGWHHARFKRVAHFRLRVSGIRPCPGTGTYSWTMRSTDDDMLIGHVLKLRVIHDACKLRVNLLAVNSNVQKDNSWYWRPPKPGTAPRDRPPAVP